MELCIDTSTTGMVALSVYNEHGVCLADNSKATGLGSQTIVPALVELFAKAGIDLKDIKRVTVNPGPGSYTGIRVGIAVAQIIGYCLNIPVNGKHVTKEIVEPIYQ